MSGPVDVQQTLDHCMKNIKGATDAMADDMYAAAMKLGAAGMMLASASNAVHQRAVQTTSVPLPTDSREDPRAEGS
jgi:hypothetical protein